MDNETTTRREDAHELAEKVRHINADHDNCAEAFEAFGVDCYSYTYCDDCRNVLLTAIADRIEALEAPKHDPDMEVFVNRLNKAAVDEQPVQLWGRDYLPATKVMELPLDADGVPIKIGDVMYWPLNGETDEVIGVGDGVFFYIENYRAEWTQASTKSHAKPNPRTIEDLIAECNDEVVGATECAFVEQRIREAFELGQKEASK